MKVDREEFRRICESRGWVYVGYDQNNRDVLYIVDEIHMKTKCSHFPPMKLTSRNLVNKSDGTDFIKIQFRGVHGDTFNYDNVQYINHCKKVEIACREHGSFMQTPDSHLAGAGCPKCAKQVSATVRSVGVERITKEVQLSGYELVSCGEEAKWNTPIEVLCHDHGVFKKTVGGFIKKPRCPQCSKERWLKKYHSTGWTYSRTNYTKMCKTSNVYLMRLTSPDGSEDFLKIGFAQNPRYRATSISKQSGYDVDLLFCWEGESGTVWDIEHYVKSSYSRGKYQPTKWFAGWTECLTIDVEVVLLIDLKEKTHQGIP